MMNDRVFAMNGHVFAMNGRVYAMYGRVLAMNGRVFAMDGGVFAMDGGVFAMNANTKIRTFALIVSLALFQFISVCIIYFPQHTFSIPSHMN